MRGWPEGFWGKFDNGEPPQWHPLVDHSLDVAACFMALMKQRLLRLRLARLGELEELTDCQVHRLALFALLHDLGKFNLGFQFKVFPRELRPPHHHHAGHVTEVGDILTDPVLASKVKERLPIAEMAEWMQTPETVVGFLCAVFSHHGQPLLLEGESSGLNRRVWNPYGNWDPFAGMAELIGGGREALPLAFQTGGDLLPARPAFLVARMESWVVSPQRSCRPSKRVFTPSCISRHFSMRTNRRVSRFTNPNDPSRLTVNRAWFR